MVHEWARRRRNQDAPLCEEERMLASPEQVTAQTCLSACQVPKSASDYRRLAQEFEDAKLLASQVSNLLNREISDGELSEISQGDPLEKMGWHERTLVEARQGSIVASGSLCGMIAIGSASGNVAGIVAGLALGYAFGKGVAVLTAALDRELRRRIAEERVGLRRSEPAVSSAQKERLNVIQQFRNDGGSLRQSSIHDRLRERSDFLRELAYQNGSRAWRLMERARKMEGGQS